MQLEENTWGTRVFIRGEHARVFIRGEYCVRRRLEACSLEWWPFIINLLSLLHGEIGDGDRDSDEVVVSSDSDEVVVSSMVFGFLFYYY